MIGTTIGYIRKRLNTHLRAALAIEADGSTPPLVDFLEGAKLDPLVLPLGSISMMVVNVKEDREFREPDRFLHRVADGAAFRMEQHRPDLHLEICVLFLAKFKDYLYAWNLLSQVMLFFQEHPLFDVEQDDDLPEGIGRLVCDLYSQSFQQQNELWSSLKIPLQPAVLYRIRVLTLRGQAVVPQPHPVQEVFTRVVAQDRSNGLRLTSPKDGLPER